MAYIQFQDPQVKQILLDHGVGSDGEITYEQAAAVTSFGSGTSSWFYNQSGITSFDEFQYFTGITSIGTYAFRYCSGLSSITIPDSITSIGVEAFSYCTGLSSIEIPDSVTTIEGSAFPYCTGLTNVTIGSGLTTIGYAVFAYCSSLSSIIIPDNVTSIGNSAFFECSSLASVTFSDTLTSIGNDAFARCSLLTSVILPNSVISIGNNAFSKCGSLSSVTFGNNLTTIGNYAFSGCTSITSIEIPDSVTTIGSSAFYKCTGLSSITIPDSVTSLGDDAFDGCSGLTSATIGNSVTRIGNHVFNGCSSLQTVIVGSSVLSFGWHAFWNCPSLEYMYFEGSTPPEVSGFEYTFKDMATPIKGYAYDEDLDTYLNTEPYSDTTKFIFTTFGIPHPVITPNGGNISTPQIITIEAPSGTVYYTLDGSKPTSASTVYTTPFAIAETTIIKAIALGDGEHSKIATAEFTFVNPSHKPARPQGGADGIFVSGITYSGTTAIESRSLTLPTPTAGDDEALVSWEYLIDGDPEELGPEGTKCKVEDTQITIHINFDYNGQTYSLDKIIPVYCQVGHIEQKREQLILDNAYGVVSLQDKLNINVKGRIKYTADNQSAIISDPSGYTLQGFTSNGNFICDIEGSYFVYNHTLVSDYSQTPSPANQVYLSLRNPQGEEVDSYVIQVTYEAGAILDVKSDAIRMAVQSGKTYTDGQISGVTNQISSLSLTVDGISTTVGEHTTEISTLSNTVSGNTSAIGTLNSTVDTLNGTVEDLTGTMTSVTTAVSGLNEDVSTISTTLTGLETTVSGNTSGIEQLNTALEGLNATVSALTSGETNLLATVSSHTQQISQLQQTASSLTSTIASINESITGITGSIETIETTVEGNTTSINNLNVTVSSHTQNISQLQQTTSSLTSTISSVQDNVSAVTNTVTTLSTTVDGISGDVSTLEITVSGHTQNISQLQQTTSSLTSTISSVQANVSSVTNTVTTLSGTVDTQGETISTLNTTVSSHTQSISQLQQTTSSLTSTISTVQDNVSSVTNSVTTLSGTVVDLDTSLGTLETTVEGQTGSITTLNTTVSSHTQQISQLQQTTSSLTSTISSVQQNVSSVTQSVTTLDGEVSDLTQTVAQHTEDISQIRQTASGISTTVEHIETDVSGLTTDVNGLETTVGNIPTTYATKSELTQTASSVTVNIYDTLNQQTGIDIESGTITMTANNGLYVKDASNNNRIIISPSTVGIKDSHTWSTSATTEIGMDGYYSGTQDNHIWNGQDEIELKHGSNKINLNSNGIEKSVWHRAQNGATITSTYYTGDISALNVRVITPTANNQSYSLDKYDGLVVVKNYSPNQYTVQLGLPDANTAFGCKIMIKPLHTTYVTAPNDIYPCGDSVPYNQGTTGVNIDNDAMVYVSDGDAWYEFKGI